MAVPLIVMAAGAAAKAYAQNQAANQQIENEQHGLNDMSAYQGKINAALNGMVAGMRGTDPNQAVAAQRADYLKALDSAMPGSREDIAGGNGYTTGNAQEAIGQHNTAINLASMLSKVQGPLEQRRQQGYQIANTGTDVSRLANFARGKYGADVGQVVQPDSGMIFLGNLAEAYGMHGLSKPGTNTPGTNGGS